jgi:glycogen debranching enzyme
MRGRLSAQFTPEVMAIDPDGHAIGGAGSQLGWLLWADALEAPAARAAADRLCEPDVLTGFGLRTLSSRSPVFAVQAYHRGSVWPFDSWLGWGGLRAAGYAAEAERVRAGVLDAVRQLGGAPELYAVSVPDGAVERQQAANYRQAWTVAAIWALENGWDGRASEGP